MEDASDKVYFNLSLMEFFIRIFSHRFSVVSKPFLSNLKLISCIVCMTSKLQIILKCMCSSSKGVLLIDVSCCQISRSTNVCAGTQYNQLRSPPLSICMRSLAHLDSTSMQYGSQHFSKPDLQLCGSFSDPFLRVRFFLCLVCFLLLSANKLIFYQFSNIFLCILVICVSMHKQFEQLKSSVCLCK